MNNTIRKINKFKNDITKKYQNLINEGWVLTKIEGNTYIFEKNNNNEEMKEIDKPTIIPKTNKVKVVEKETIEKNINKIRNMLGNVRKELRINTKLTKKERNRLKIQAIALKKSLTSK